MDVLDSGGFENIIERAGEIFLIQKTAQKTSGFLS
jgi:hypothetical protein